ncbi:MAG: c-type cytochrome [Candidatus Marinimicrobia bacterium]|nr:c-type cytochrome [Candidatus Neomarinimicrobiota bacterium]
MIEKWSIAIISTFILISCGGGDKTDSGKPAVSEMTARGISKTQLEHGIGPITSFSLGPADARQAERGQAVFTEKCIACHKIDERLVGPPLRGVVDRRSPAFILNMILNPDEMVKKHPEIQKMLAQYYVPMTFQDVTEADARAILEYLRTL